MSGAAQGVEKSEMSDVDRDNRSVPEGGGEVLRPSGERTESQA